MHRRTPLRPSGGWSDGSREATGSKARQGLDRYVRGNRASRPSTNVSPYPINLSFRDNLSPYGDGDNARCVVHDEPQVTV